MMVVARRVIDLRRLPAPNVRVIACFARLADAWPGDELVAFLDPHEIRLRMTGTDEWEDAEPEKGNP